MWNRKAFSVVPLVFALMVGVLGVGSTLAQAAPVIDLNSSSVGGVAYTSATWVNGETFDFGPVKITYSPYVSGPLQKITVRLGDGDPSTSTGSPDYTDEKIYAGLTTYGSVKIVTNNLHSFDIVPTDPTPGVTASASDYNSALNDLYYDNKSIKDGADPNPANFGSVTPGNRTVTFTATDASGSGAAATTVPVDSLNDAPTISPTSTNAEFIEKGDKAPPLIPGVQAFSGAAVNEPEEQLITRMSFNLNGNVDNAKRTDADQSSNAVEKLLFAPSESGFGVSGSVTSGTLTVSAYVTNPVSHIITYDTRSLNYTFSTTTGVMDVTGNAYDNQYQLVIQHLRYDNSALDPTETDRQVVAQAFDAEKGSFAAVSTISVKKSDNRVDLSRTAAPGPVASGPNNTTTLSFHITDVDDETFNGTPIQDQVVNYNREAASTAASTDPYIDIQIAVTHGTISLGTTGAGGSPIPNLKFVYGSNNSANMEFYGRQQDINTVLTGITFKSDASYVDNALFTISADDQDNTGIPSPKFRPIFLQNIGPGSGSGAIPHISLDGDAPLDVDGYATASSPFSTIFVFGAGEIKVADTDVFLSDKDDNITSVTVSIADPSNDGAAENLNTPVYDASKVVINYNPVTKVLTLTKQAAGTEVDLENVLKLITYNHAPGTTTGTQRTITFVVSDAAANFDSAATTITFDKGGPVLNLDADDSSGAGSGDFTKTYVPGGPATQITDSDITVVDPDGIDNSATVKLRLVENTPDELLLVDTSGTNITSAYDATTGTLSLTGVDTDANYRQVLASVRYSNVSGTPTQNPRIFDITVSDKANSDTHTSTLLANSTPPPSSSFIDLDADDSSGATGSDYTAQWNQSGLTTLADTDAYIDETDNTIQKLTVTIANNTRKDGINEILSATVGSSGIVATYDTGTGVLTLQGPASEAAYITVLRSVNFQDTAAVPNGNSRDFRFDVFGNSNNTITATALTTISITGGGSGGTGISSIDLDANDSSGAVDPGFQASWNQASTTVIADTDATVDNDAGTIQSVTVQINSRPDGASEVLDAAVSGPITKSFNSATGLLTLTGPGTPAQFIPVVRSVTYKDNAATINGTSRSFTFSVNGGTNTPTATTLISTTGGGGGTSSIDLDTDDSSGATGNDYQTTWDQAVTTVIADTDATVGNDSGTIQSVTVQINNRLDGAVEVLDATVAVPITKSFDVGTGILTLSGPATPAQFIPALRSVTYKNNAATINGTIRTFTFSVIGGINSATATATISTVGGPTIGNGTATLDLNGTDDAGKNYVVNSVLNATVHVTDSDAIVDNRDSGNGVKNLTKITVTISDQQDDLNEVLAATANSGVGKSYNAATGVLTLTGLNAGSATPAEFQNVLRSITYKDNQETPTGTSRTLEFRVYGADNNVVQTTTITTTGGGGSGGNGTGVSSIDLNGADGTGFNFSGKLKGQTATPAADSDAIVTNTDGQLEKITVTIANRLDDLSEVLTAPGADKGDGKSINPNVVASYNSGNGVLTLTGPATPAEFQYAVRSVSYINNLVKPTGTSRSLEFRVIGGLQDVFATTTLSTTGGTGGGGGGNIDITTDTDGDGIPDYLDPDSNNNGIPDDQDNGNTLGGSLGDDTDSLGNPASRIDLNGNGPGYNFTTKWISGAQNKLADSDSTIKGNDMVQKLVVSIDGGARDVGESMSATSAGGIVSTYTGGVLTLQGPATRQAFQTVLRSVQYTNATTVDVYKDGKVIGTVASTPTGTTRKFRFDLYGDVDEIDTLTSSAVTTIDLNAGNNLNNNMFTGSSSVSGDTATIVYRVRNISGQTMTGINITGRLAGGRPFSEAAEVSASIGTATAKFVTPDKIKRYLQPDKFGGKNVSWRIDSLGAGQEAVLTITVPLLKDTMGDKLTETWKAVFPNGITESVNPMMVH